MIEAAFKCIEVGNWYSEYECSQCKARIVVHDEDPTPTKCPECGAHVSH